MQRVGGGVSGFKILSLTNKTLRLNKSLLEAEGALHRGAILHLELRKLLRHGKGALEHSLS